MEPFGELGPRLLLCTSLTIETKAVWRGCSTWPKQPRIVQVGMGPDAARRNASTAIRSLKPKFVVVIGFAGSLVEDLRVGDAFQADNLAAEPLRPVPQPACVDLPIRSAMLVSVPSAAGTVEAKSKLRAATGAAAVDMESAAVANVCADAGIPFAVVRAVSDGCDEELPPEVLRWTNADGNLRFGRLVPSLVLNPRLWPKVARLARNGRAAANALTNVVESLARIGVPRPVERGHASE